MHGSSFTAAPQSGKPKLLDQVRQLLRLRHYSLRTEEAYLGWIRRNILFHGKRATGNDGHVKASLTCQGGDK
jgi:integrase-like protein